LHQGDFVHPILRIFGILAVFALTAAGWLLLGGVNESRSNSARYDLGREVGSLWGRAQTQAAPTFTLQWSEEVLDVKENVGADGTVYSRNVQRRLEARSVDVDPTATDIQVALNLDERRKGLLWFPLYDVDFSGNWTYTHAENVERTLLIRFAFPDQDALYDEFRFEVDGVDLGSAAAPIGGSASTTLLVQPGQIVRFAVHYRSRGAESWHYQPSVGVGQVGNFRLQATTDFKAVDFAVPGRSPTQKSETPEGWSLEWAYDRAVSGFGMGIVMPNRIQPGELASSLAFSAPLSLGLYFLWIYVLGLLRSREAHPINYLFIAGGFFAFNLLFSYTADHLPVEQAFALSAAVSVGLVVSYLRLVLGSRFAFLEAGLAQLLYQVGFATAHFVDGLTGLTVTVLGILTLFALMQLTGRIDWTVALGQRKAGIATG
jgi:hypothetical protein